MYGLITLGGQRRGSTRKWRINRACEKLVLNVQEQNAIQVKYTASISDRVNGVKCDISVFFTAAFCSVVEFDRSGIEIDQPLEELTTRHHRPNVKRYFDPCWVDKLISK